MSERGSRLRRILLPAVGVGVLALAGCSGGSSGGDAAPAPGSQGASGTTVSIRSSDKGEVLTNQDGRTLYKSDEENGRVLCKSSSCTAIWTPLTVAAGQTPSGPTQLQGGLTTVTRSDGKTQVALDGKPLYSFAFDHAAGDVNGDGAKDRFDGTDFTWRAATANGAGPAPAPSSSSSTGTRYGY